MVILSSLTLISPRPDTLLYYGTVAGQLSLPDNFTHDSSRESLWVGKRVNSWAYSIACIDAHLSSLILSFLDCPPVLCPMPDNFTHDSSRESLGGKKGLGAFPFRRFCTVIAIIVLNLTLAKKNIGCLNATMYCRYTNYNKSNWLYIKLFSEDF